MTHDRTRGLRTLFGAIALLGALCADSPARAHAPPDPRRPLSDDAVESLAATARVFGYVRHFNPAIESLRVDWALFAANAALVMEGVEGAEARVEALSRLFGSVAPAAMFYATGDEAPEIELIRASPEAPIIGVNVWDHRGYGLIHVPIGPFYSNRMRIALEDGRMLRRFPDPMTPHRADVGGGVSCVVPASLWVNQDGRTLPLATQEADSAVPRPLNTASAEERRRAVRIADVMIAYNVLRHFHPWADLSEAEWDDALRASLRVAAVSDDADARGRARAVSLLLARLGDGQAHVVEQEPSPEYAPPLAFEFIGDRLLITGVRAGAARNPDAPAPGDEVVTINGEPLIAPLERELPYVAGANEPLRRWVALENIALGARDSELTLGVRAEDGRVRNAALRRTEPPSAMRAARPGVVSEPAPGVVYIDASRMDEDELFNELQKHGAARGVIFDYRAAADGALGAQLGILIKGDGPIEPAQNWIPTPRLPDRVNLEFLHFPTILITKPPGMTAKFVFLADGRTMGKAEADLITVREASLGVIVGERTAGAPGEHLSQEWLPGGMWLRWSGMIVRAADGDTYERRGVEPDIEVVRTVRGVAAGRDEALERAVELLSR